MSDEYERARERLIEEMEAEHWNCPLCGEGYPSRDNAGVSEELERKVLAAMRPAPADRPFPTSATPSVKFKR